MKIIVNPTDAVNKNIECRECGAVFRLNKRDIRKGIFYIYNSEGKKDIYVGCPCCNNHVLLNEVENSEKRAYNNVIEMFKEAAEEIKLVSDPQKRVVAAKILDGLYNKVYNISEELDGKIN